MAKAIFMMGGPAAGKSTIQARDYAGLLVVNADSIKEEHPDYDVTQPSLLHEWSSTEATRRFYAAIAAGVDVVFDGTGNTAEKYVLFINAAHTLGYTTEVCYVTVDLAVALARNAQRARVVPEAVVRQRHASVATSFDIVSRYAGVVRIVNN